MCISFIGKYVNNVKFEKVIIFGEGEDMRGALIAPEMVHH